MKRPLRALRNFIHGSRRTLILSLLLMTILQLILLGGWWLTWPPVILSFVVPIQEAEAWAKPIAAFERQHPKIRFNLVTGDYSTDALQAIYTADFQAQSPQYDLIYLDIIWTVPFATAGQLRDLSETVDKTSLAQFLPSEVRAGRYQGKLYRFPFRTDVGVLLSREDLLQEGGETHPQDFEALGQIAQRLQKQQIAEVGYLWQGQAYEGLVAHFVEILDGFGGFWVNPETQTVGLDEPEAIAAATFLRSLITRQITPTDVTRYDEYSSLDRFMEQGDTVFLRSWPIFGALARAQYPQVSIHPLPRQQDRLSRSVRGGWGLGIASGSAHPQEAWQAIAFFTRVDVQREFALESGFLPSRTALFTDPALVQRYPDLPQIQQILEEQSVFRPAIAQYPQASAILQTHLWEILTGTVDPATGMSAAAAETQQLLGAALGQRMNERRSSPEARSGG